ncbi:Putative superoxide dismutase, Ni-type (NiSOD) [Desulfatibacillum aliphaticivorans]|uniref:Superoxide dismutase, Ni-type (NiSOD) n=1 Tax=Desulfatibacillum aliphaticivorans TaxID=218208 RepID=B8FHU5_DESAL|nr:superoxide dismutase, Ni [Desulfatibacillum aliphaticivorans]ACL02512.1 Putative superoxide dismutase, Ni-type (NiSOD) [Desulfatibacillum aliphaticivorans]
MKKARTGLLAVLLVLGLFTANAMAHCEIPCGIYDDPMRIAMLNEHIATIEKSMKSIIELERADHPHYNQLVRWINNKEDHANQFQEIVTQYFMTQRIKLDAPDYDKKIATLHRMLVYAMKCKQTTDLQNVVILRSLVKEFETLYFAK